MFLINSFASVTCNFSFSILSFVFCYTRSATNIQTSMFGHLSKIFQLKLCYMFVLTEGRKQSDVNDFNNKVIFENVCPLSRIDRDQIS